MVNHGQIIQLKDKFRMPYGPNKNTISSCSQIMQGDGIPSQMKKKKGGDKNKQRVIKDDGSSKSNESSKGSDNLGLLNADGYISYKAKYNNKNKSLIICKKASSGHTPLYHKNI